MGAATAEQLRRARQKILTMPGRGPVAREIPDSTAALCRRMQTWLTLRALTRYQQPRWTPATTLLLDAVADTADAAWAYYTALRERDRAEKVERP